MTKITKKAFLLTSLFIISSLINANLLFAQIGIGTDTPDASSILEVESTTKGFLPPRMSKMQMEAIVSPIEGLVMYCTDCSPMGLYVYNGSIYISSSTGEQTTASNTGLGSTFTMTGTNGEAFSSNGTCGAKTISATACSITELANGIGYDPDGNGYSVVQIKDATSGYIQCWMAENIQDGAGPENAWVNLTDNGWYGYLGDADQTPDTPPTTDDDGTTGSALAYNEKEGFIYQWSAAMDGETAERSQGICPSGWHIPSDCEWMFLENNLGMSTTDQENTLWRGGDQGTKLKENGSSNFEGVLTGYRDTSGSFMNRNEESYYWSSSLNGSDVFMRSLGGSTMIFRNSNPKSYAWPVRCLKD